jgi:hypothetical protein
MSGNSRVVAEIAAPAAVLKDCWQHMPEIEQFDVAPGEAIISFVRSPRVTDWICGRWSSRECVSTAGHCGS